MSLQMPADMAAMAWPYLRCGDDLAQDCKGDLLGQASVLFEGILPQLAQDPCKYAVCSVALQHSSKQPHSQQEQCILCASVQATQHLTGEASQCHQQ